LAIAIPDPPAPGPSITAKQAYSVCELLRQVAVAGMAMFTGYEKLPYLYKNK